MSDNKNEFYIYLLPTIPIIWIALLIAPCIDKGLIYSISQITNALNDPFDITWCNNSLKVIIIFLVIYFIYIGLYLSNTLNKLPNKEYGSAHWANAKQVTKLISNPDYFENKLMTQNFRMGLTRQYHGYNLHSLVIGGSGSGKTRYYVMPNLMQCNSSYVVLDPKGDIVRNLGHLLEKEGYVIKVFDLINMDKSHGYNPFKYLQDEKDVLKLINNLIKNTTPKNSSTSDPFWDKAETTLLQAIMLYLYEEAPIEEQNFSMVIEMIAAAEVKEDDENYMSPLDELFERLEFKNPDSLALKIYRIYKLAPAKTTKSILISAGVRLQSFFIDSVKRLTLYDELELDKLATRKTALFCIIPDNDSTFNYLIGMLYTQIFQVLYYQSDYVFHGSLPVTVQMYMDEFANVSIPEDFEKVLNTMRSRGLSVSIILQGLSQLKGLYKDSWETLVSSCDEIFYLGGNEQSTHEYLSKYLGKQTIVSDSYSESKGHSGNYSKSTQKIARELLTIDEVRTLDRKKGLIILGDKMGMIDKKYDLKSHPRYKDIVEAGAPKYLHGLDRHSIDDWQNIVLSDNEYELLSEKDLEKYLIKLDEQERLEEKKNEKTNN